MTKSIHIAGSSATVLLTDDAKEAATIQFLLFFVEGYITKLTIYCTGSKAFLVDFSGFSRLTHLTIVGHSYLDINNSFLPLHCHSVYLVALVNCSVYADTDVKDSWTQVRTLVFVDSFLSVPISNVFPYLESYRGSFDIWLAQSILPQLTTCVCTHGIPVDDTGRNFLDAHPSIHKCSIGIYLFESRDPTTGEDVTSRMIYNFIRDRYRLDMVIVCDVAGSPLDVVHERMDSSPLIQAYQDQVIEILNRVPIEYDLPQLALTRDDLELLAASDIECHFEMFDMETSKPEFKTIGFPLDAYVFDDNVHFDTSTADATVQPARCRLAEQNEHVKHATIDSDNIEDTDYELESVRTGDDMESVSDDHNDDNASEIDYELESVATDEDPSDTTPENAVHYPAEVSDLENSAESYIGNTVLRQPICA